MDPVLAAITSWLSSKALTAGDLRLRRLLLGDKQQNALRSLVQTAIESAVEETAPEGTRDVIQDALLREDSRKADVVVEDTLDMRACIELRLSTCATILNEQGYAFDVERFSDYVSNHVAAGIQANAAHDGPLKPIADLLRYEHVAHSADEAVAQLKLINLKLNAAFGRMQPQSTDISTLFDQLGISSPVMDDSRLHGSRTGFTGREWMLPRIDDFLSANDRGYLLIEGEAGVGKSAFALWLAATRGYTFHSTLLPDGRNTTIAVQAIARQLITRYDLTYFAYDLVSPSSDQPRWLHQIIIDAAARHRVMEPDVPLVIVVDGLDEADSTSGPPFGLPQTLPSGIFIIVTLRSGTPLRWLREKYTTCKLSQASEMNLNDMRRYLRAVANEADFATKISAAESVSIESFVSTLMGRCSGSWIYLHYVLDEFRAGTRFPTDLEQLPEGLWNYYTENVAALRSNIDLWETLYLPVMATLAAAQEPLSIGALATLAGTRGANSQIRRFLNGPWRPFCRTIDEEWYELYHLSLRDYLAGVPAHTDDSNRPEFVVNDRAELRRATHDCHVRICERFLAAWGGLDYGIPRLAENTELAFLDTGYGLRHLPAHLEAASRGDDLHRLLACEVQSNASSHVENVWYLANERAGSPANYLDHIKRAERLAQRGTTPAGANRKEPSNIGLEIRYKLIQASLVSRASNLPPELITALVKQHVWPPAQALTHIRNIVDPAQLLHAVISLYLHFPQSEQSTIIAAALKSTTAINDGWTCARAVAAVAPYLTSEASTAVLAEARRIHNHGARAEALVGLAPYLPEAECLGIFAAALEAALRVGGDYARANALSAIIPRLPSTLLTDALEGAQLLYSYDRMGVLSVLAPRLSEDLLARAVTLANNIDDDSPRARALGVLAEHLPEASRAELLSAALGSAIADNDDHAKTEALCALAPQLPSHLLPPALSAACAIGNDDWRTEALSAMAPCLSSALLATALEGARSIQYGPHRAKALIKLATHTQGPQQAAAFADAMEAIRSVEAGWPLANSISTLAVILPPVLLPTTLEAVQAIAFEGPKGYALSELAPHMPPSLLTSALATAYAIDQEFPRAESLCALAIAPQLPQSHQTDALAAALKAALAVESTIHRAYLLSDLVPYLTQTEQLTALAATLEAAFTIDDPARQAEVLKLVAPYLPSTTWPTSLTAALEKSLALDYEPSVALSVIAPYLPDQQLISAITAAGAISHEASRKKALGALAPHLSPTLLTYTLEAALAISDDIPRAGALGALAIHLPETEEPRAFAIALDEIIRVMDTLVPTDALAELAPYLSQPLINRALDAIQLMTYEPAQVKALLALTPHIAPEILPKAFRIARGVKAPWWRAEALAILAGHLPQGQQESAFSEALRSALALEDDDLRAHSLNALAPLLPTELMADVFTAAMAIGPDWRRANSLAALAPYLSPPLMSPALRAACALGEESRAEGISALASYLPPALIRSAIESAEAITYSGWRQEALRGLAPYRLETERSKVIAVALEASLSTPHDLISLFPHLNASQLAVVLQAAESQSEIDRAHTLTELVRYLPAELMDSALSAVLSIDFEYSRAHTLGAFAPYLSPTQLSSAVDAARAIGDQQCRAEALVKLAPELYRLNDMEHDDNSRAVDIPELLTGLIRKNAFNVLAAAASPSLVLGGAGTYSTCFGAVVDVAKWWP